MSLTYSAYSFRFACNPENPKILYILIQTGVTLDTL